MAKMIVVYASMSGNTEEMAQAIAEGIREEGGTVVLKDVWDTDTAELIDYDGIMFGSYTWSGGELPDEFLDFYEELLTMDFSGKKVAVFGSCDSSYTEYGGAVDFLVEGLNSLGADVACEGLKIELCPTEAETQHCRDFGKHFSNLLQPVG